MFVIGWILLVVGWLIFVTGWVLNFMTPMQQPLQGVGAGVAGLGVLLLLAA